MSRKMKKTKEGTPSWTHNDVVMGWRLENGLSVPAIEQSRISIIKFPVEYYQHFYYSPELMEARDPDIKRLGWSSHSFDLPKPPELIGECSLLSEALITVGKILNGRIVVRRNWPTNVTCEEVGNGKQSDYFVLYFNHYAHEFYDILYEIGKEPSVVFKLPDQKLDTLPQLLKWSKSHEARRKRMYKCEGFTWQPVSIKKDSKEAE